ncbi:MAG: glycosyltransferase family 2 protein [Lachnospiraceae bacterium]|nr:glycosyltransferase family 2 protein [Lachnospiraceae bacterium]
MSEKVSVKVNRKLRQLLGRLRYGRRAAGKNEKYTLSVVVIVKNEGAYLREWLLYHKLAGVSHIYLYDNGSTDDSAAIAKSFAAEGFVTYTFMPGRCRQMPSYNDALKRFGNESRYMAFIDADEFLFSPGNEEPLAATVDLLFKKYPKASGLAVNWAMFGSSGFEKKPESGGVLANFIYRAEIGKPGTDCIKTIVKPETVVSYDHPHYPVYMLGACSVDESGKKVAGWSNPGIEPLKLRVNHYFTKSREEWTLRRSAGMADKEDPNVRRTIEEFVRHDNNDIFDDSMRRYSERIGQVMRRDKER